MNFNWLLDGSIVGLYLVATMAAGIMVRKYVGNVEQFLVAGREMNVFLGIASLAATEFGIVTCMYTAQGGYNSGFAGWPPQHGGLPSHWGRVPRTLDRDE
jgi:SSS family solute:Na+ symporter